MEEEGVQEDQSAGNKYNHKFMQHEYTEKCAQE